VAVPEEELATSKARAMLPATVPHGDAAFTAGRAALLVEALTRRPDLLLAATRERLHQEQRAPAMPATADAIAGLRAAGHAAVVSGAGPSILILVPDADTPGLDAIRAVAGPGWAVQQVAIDTQGVQLVTEG
jgi:homoserine kinase